MKLHQTPENVDSRRARRQRAAWAGLALYSFNLLSCGPGGLATSSPDGTGDGLSLSSYSEPLNADSSPLAIPSGTLLPSAPAGSLASGTTPVQADVTADGAASVSIPLWVPPGRAGMQPGLSLNYSSRAGDGWLGMGFQLSGLSQITPCAKTLAQGSELSTPRFGPQGPSESSRAYCLDGQRLIRRFSNSDDFYPEVGNSHVKVRLTETDSQGPLSFEVLAADGRIFTYGKMGTRYDAVWSGTSVSAGELRMAWHLASVRDRWNNRMDVFYESSGQSDTYHSWSRPKRMAYTSRELATGNEEARRFVDFEYEARPDTFLGYQGGQRIGRQHRLRAIKMSGPPDTEATTAPAELRRYTLRYAATGTNISGRSLLSEVQECDGQGACKPPVRFDWELGSWEWDDKAVAEIPEGSMGLSGGVHVVGLGAGRTGLSYNIGQVQMPDEDCAKYQAPRCVDWRYHKHRVLTYRYPSIPELPYELSAPARWQTYKTSCPFAAQYKVVPHLVDWDGLGKSSLAVLSCGMLPGDEDRPDGTQRWTFEYYRILPDRPEGPQQLHRQGIGTTGLATFWVDLDGDGINTDLEDDAADINDMVWLGNTHLYPSKQGERLVDLAGDGSTQLVGGGSSGSGGTMLAHGEKISWTSTGPERASYTRGTTIQGPFWHSQSDDTLRLRPPAFTFADVNGDGLADALAFGYDMAVHLSRMDTQLNRGLGSDTSETYDFAPLQSRSFSSLLTAYHVEGSATRTLDADGDGRQDVLLVTPGQNLRVLLAGPEADFTRARELPIPSGDSVKWVQVADVNNDGLSDITRLQGRQLRIAFRKHQADVLRAVRPGNQLPDSTGKTGLEYSFYYAPLADPEVYSTTVTDSTDVRRVPETMLVVKTQGLRVNGGTQRYWAYDYRGGRYDVKGRRFLGFDEHHVEDSGTGARSVTYFTNRQSGARWLPGAHLPVRRVETADVGTGPQRQREVQWEYETPTPTDNAAFHGTQFYVKRERETVSERPSGGAFITLSERETERTQDMFGITTSSSSRVFTGSKVEEVRTEVTPGGQSTALFDASTWLPAGTWVTKTGWVECAASALGPCAGVQPSEANQRVSQVTYGGAGEVSTVEVMPGSAAENLDATTSAYYLKTEYTRDPRGLVNQVTRTDASGTARQEFYVYDRLDATTLRHTYDSLGHGARYAFLPGMGVLAAVEDANGAGKRLRYDGFGRLREETDYAGGGHSVEFAWEGRLPVVKTWVRGGGDSITRFNALGQQVQREAAGPGGVRVFVDTTYDWLGRLEKQSLPRKEQEEARFVTLAYDYLSRVLRQTQPDGTAVVTTYEATAQGLRTSVTDADGRRRQQLTDRRGLLVEASDVADGGRLLTTRYEYGPFGQLTAAVTPDGARTHQRHDRLGRLEWSSDESAGERFFAYSGFGEVKWSADAAWRSLPQPLPATLPTTAYGLQTSLAYDAVGRVTQQVVRAPNQTGDDFRERVTYTWDQAYLGNTGNKALGRLYEAKREMTLETATDPARPSVVTRYAYDDLGRTASSTLLINSESFTTAHTYDTYGRAARTLYPQVPGLYPELNDNSRLTVEYTYAPEGNVQSVRNPHTNEVYWTALAFNTAGQLTREKLGTEVDRTLRYDPLGRLRFLDAKRGATYVQRLSYEYSPGGNLTARHDVLGANPELSQPQPTSETFAYDALDRLKRWEVTQGGCGATTGVDFNYDDAGNLLSRVTSGAVTASYGPTAAGTFPRNALAAASVDGTVFRYNYDARGNQARVTNGNGAVLSTASYASFNLPTVIWPVSGRRWSFDYDASGNRVRKVASDNTEEVYSVGSLYQRRRTGTTVTHLMSVQGPTGTVAEVSWTPGASRTTRYLLSDRSGSPDAVLAADGTLLQRLRYEPFGRRASASSLLQPHTGAASALRTGFTGHEDDFELGLINMRGRMYDARLARFLSPDPVIADPTRGQAFHPYAYVLNNPLKYTDPSGLTPEGIPGINISSQADYGGGWTGQVFTAGPSSGPERDPLLDQFLNQGAVGDSPQAPVQQTVDNGTSAPSSPGPQPSLLEMGLSAVARTAGELPCGLSITCNLAAQGMAMHANQAMETVRTYEGYAEVGHPIAGAVMAVNQHVPFVTAGENALRTKKACAAGSLGGCGLGTLKTSAYVLMAGAAIFAAGEGAAGAPATASNVLRSGLKQLGGGAKTGQNLFAFGNKTAPRLPRPGHDVFPDAQGVIPGQSGVELPLGASAFGDVSQAPLKGHYHCLPAGTCLPDGLGFKADGVDVIPHSPHPATHFTIFPTRDMPAEEFNRLFLGLHWEYAGNKK